MYARNILPLALGAISLAAAGGQVASASGGRTVTLRNIAFSPKNLSISRGTTVTFDWRDDTRHNVTSTGSRRFASIPSRVSGKRSRTFGSAGTYTYHCTLHPGMSGRITVH